MDPTLTALSAVFFLSSMCLFVYGFRERKREIARANQPVIDLRDPAPAAADARQRV